MTAAENFIMEGGAGRLPYGLEAAQQMLEAMHSDPDFSPAENPTFRAVVTLTRADADVILPPDDGDIFGQPVSIDSPEEWNAEYWQTIGRYPSVWVYVSDGDPQPLLEVLERTRPAGMPVPRLLPYPEFELGGKESDSLHTNGSSNSNGTHSNLTVTVDPVVFTGRPIPGERKWFIDGIIPERLPTLNHGDGGSTKSMQGLAHCLCVASGKPYIGKVVAQGPAAYLDFEFDQDEQHRRAAAVARGLGLSDVPSDFVYFPFTGFTFSRVQKNVLAWLRDHPNGFLVLDSYGLASTGDSKDEGPVIAFMRTLLEMKSGAFEMLDHESKAQFGEGQEHKKAYGSVYKYNMSRLVWQSLKSGEEQHKWGSNTFVRLRCRKNNLGPLFPDIGLMLTFRTKSNGTLDTITFTQADPAAWPAGDDATIEVRIVEHLRAEGPATIIDVAKAIGENPNSVKAKMMLLQKRGVVVQVGKDGGRAIYALKGSSNSNLS